MSIKSVLYQQLAIIVAILIVSLAHGWTLKLLWEWFMVPTFGLVPLKLLPAIGIALLVRVLTTPQPIPLESKLGFVELVAYEAFGNVVLSVSCLGVGWALHFFM